MMRSWAIRGLWVGHARLDRIHIRRGFPANIYLILAPPVKLLRRSSPAPIKSLSALPGGRFVGLMLPVASRSYP